MLCGHAGTIGLKHYLPIEDNDTLAIMSGISHCGGTFPQQLCG